MIGSELRYFTFFGIKNKEASVTNLSVFKIVMSLKRKRSILSIKDKNEDADDIVFQMIVNCCFTIKCRFLN